jgi:hypothetical protein
MDIHIPGIPGHLHFPSIRGGESQGRTEHAPSQRYKVILWIVAILFVAIVVYLTIDAVLRSE